MSQTTTPPATRRAETIERRSIDYVPRAERHGKVWHQGPFWFTGNFVLLTMLVGFTGPSMGLSFWWTALAILLGIGFGTFFMAFHANQGPQLGLPQMIQSRAQFGRKGAILPFLATVFVYIGFTVFGTIVITEAVQQFLPGSKWFWYPFLIAIAIVTAIFGHDLLHFIQRWLTYLLIPVFAIVTVLAFIALPDAPSTGELGWNGPAFLVQLAVAAGYNISYSVYVSDYSRYLPESSSGPRLIFWTYLGAAGSATWLMSVGALLAVTLPELDGVSGLIETGNRLFPGFGVFVIWVAIIAQQTIAGINAYGAMLTGASAVDGFTRLRPTVRTRVIGLIVVGVVATAIALLIPDDYLGSFNDFVTLMLYFLIPWTAVNLVDFYFVRHGKYAITEIFKEDGIYGQWAWRGIVSYLAGFAVMIPFFRLGFYTGPITEALGGADIGFLFGLVVAGGLYFLLSRNVDRTAEAEARERSERELEG